MDIIKAERKAKVDAVAGFLERFLHESPLKAEYTGCFWNMTEFAEHIVRKVEEAEHRFDEAYFAQREANAEKAPF